MTDIFAPGVVFAGYRIERVLGSGGMGTVYLAAHPRLPRFDAVKVLPEALGADPEYRARFVREAELAARLDHPNIVAVRDRGVERGFLWIAMQFVDGTDAAGALRRSPGGLDSRLSAYIVGEAARGLDEAHRAGLLHRDVKPANLLLESRGANHPPRVYVSDFGIARGATDTAGLTETGSLLATVAYAAPEQIMATAIDHRADVYALGCTLYELLTGAKPFPRPTPAAVMHAHLTDPPPRPTAQVPGLPPAFDAIIARALAKNPDDRYPSCGALAADAVAAAGSPAAPGPPIPKPPPLRPPRRGVRRMVAAVAVTLVVVAGVVAVVAARDKPAAPPPAAASATTTPAAPASTASSPFTWGRYQYVVEPFPRLLPAEPLSSGYKGIRCVMIDSRDVKQIALDAGPRAGVPEMSCQGDRNPVDHLSVLCNANRTPSTVPRFAEVTIVGDQPWERASGRGRLVWGDTVDDRGPRGILGIQFDDPARNHCLITLFGGADGQELVDRWWHDAPL
ncbi:serine/threonine-protein kinase [Nocardia transvalensis]|uniref:non-specific serine/threonine protein kinase n=1 Tax=Nocardia transvalensis TaxID=37333 RepID=A0A7W9PJF4_9NOCA|nr:serine/threonine-protein kinase [Nocardia transvalensis]MBB5916583.1 serine/threonine-protein kinase [Nocardia transvalensis]